MIRNILSALVVLGGMAVLSSPVRAADEATNPGAAVTEPGSPDAAVTPPPRIDCRREPWRMECRIDCSREFWRPECHGQQFECFARNALGRQFVAYGNFRMPRFEVQQRALDMCRYNSLPFLRFTCRAEGCR